MTEARMQYECVTWFRNTYKNYRGRLVEINNNTNKGAHRKGMGLVKSASDLILFLNNYLIVIELKVDGSRHDVSHLKRQLDYINGKNFNTRYSYGVFAFSVEHFKTIVEKCIIDEPNCGMGIVDYITEINEYIRVTTSQATTKTVKLDFFNWFKKNYATNGFTITETSDISEESFVKIIERSEGCLRKKQ